MLANLLLFLCTPAVHAQQADSATFDKRKIYYWGGAHIGGGSYFINVGLDGGMLIQNTLIIAVNTQVSTSAPFSQTLTKTADEHSLLFGFKLTRRAFSNWSLLSGVSLLKLTDRGEALGPNGASLTLNPIIFGPDKVYEGVGVPIVLKYDFIPAPVFGMHFSGACNINPHRNFFQLNFGFAFGQLRSWQAGEKPKRPLHDELPLRPKLFKH